MYRDRCISFVKKMVDNKEDKRIIASIKAAQSFYFGEAADMFVFAREQDRFLFSEVLPLLPYKTVWFSFDMLEDSRYEKTGPVNVKGECVLIDVLEKTTNIYFFTNINIGASHFDLNNSGKYAWALYPFHLVVNNADYSFRIAGFRGAGYRELLRDDRWLVGKSVTENFMSDCGYVLSDLKLAVTALSCKNIRPVKVLPCQKINKKRKMTGKEPLYAYHTLDVILPGRRCIAEPGGPTGRTVRLHLCRGHFKEYTPERPLFGKHTGRYWWQPIARGDKRAGVVMKNYNVKVEGGRA